MRWKLVLSLLLAAVGSVPLFVALASAQIAVNDVLLSFQPEEKPVKNIIVSNSAEGPVYVTTSVDLVTNPGKGSNEFQPTDDILLSPKRFSIDSKGQRTVRLLLRKPRENTEAVYRILFVPQDSSFGLESSTEVAGRKTSIKVLTGMGVLVFVDPLRPTRELSFERTPTEIVFKNSGNAHVRLTDGQACDLAGANCIPLSSKRIYGGEQYAVPVSADKAVSYNIAKGLQGGFEKLAIPPFGTQPVG